MNGGCKVCGDATRLDADGLCADEGACFGRVRRASVPKGVRLSWPWRIALSVAACIAEHARDHETVRVLDKLLADDARIRWPR